MSSSVQFYRYLVWLTPYRLGLLISSGLPYALFTLPHGYHTRLLRSLRFIFTFGYALRTHARLLPPPLLHWFSTGCGSAYCTVATRRHALHLRLPRRSVRLPLHVRYAGCGSRRIWLYIPVTRLRLPHSSGCGWLVYQVIPACVPFTGYLHLMPVLYIPGYLFGYWLPVWLRLYGLHAHVVHARVCRTVYSTRLLQFGWLTLPAVAATHLPFGSPVRGFLRLLRLRSHGSTWFTHYAVPRTRTHTCVCAAAALPTRALHGWVRRLLVAFVPTALPCCAVHTPRCGSAVTIAYGCTRLFGCVLQVTQLVPLRFCTAVRCRYTYRSQFMPRTRSSRISPRSRLLPLRLRAHHTRCTHLRSPTCGYAYAVTFWLFTVPFVVAAPFAVRSVACVTGLRISARFCVCITVPPRLHRLLPHLPFGSLPFTATVLPVCCVPGLRSYRICGLRFCVLPVHTYHPGSALPRLPYGFVLHTVTVTFVVVHVAGYVAVWLEFRLPPHRYTALPRCLFVRYRLPLPVLPVAVVIPGYHCRLRCTRLRLHDYTLHYTFLHTRLRCVTGYLRYVPFVRWVLVRYLRLPRLRGCSLRLPLPTFGWLLLVTAFYVHTVLFARLFTCRFLRLRCYTVAVTAFITVYCGSFRSAPHHRLRLHRCRLPVGSTLPFTARLRTVYLPPFAVTVAFDSLVTLPPVTVLRWLRWLLRLPALRCLVTVYYLRYTRCVYDVPLVTVPAPHRTWFTFLRLRLVPFVAFDFGCGSGYVCRTPFCRFPFWLRFLFCLLDSAVHYSTFTVPRLHLHIFVLCSCYLLGCCSRFVCALRSRSHAHVYVALQHAAPARLPHLHTRQFRVCTHAFAHGYADSRTLPLRLPTFTFCHLPLHTVYIPRLWLLVPRCSSVTRFYTPAVPFAVALLRVAVPHHAFTHTPTPPCLRFALPGSHILPRAFTLLPVTVYGSPRSARIPGSRVHGYARTFTPATRLFTYTYGSSRCWLYYRRIAATLRLTHTPHTYAHLPVAVRPGWFYRSCRLRTPTLHFLHSIPVGSAVTTHAPCGYGYAVLRFVRFYVCYLYTVGPVGSTAVRVHRSPPFTVCWLYCTCTRLRTLPGCGSPRGYRLPCGCGYYRTVAHCSSLRTYTTIGFTTPFPFCGLRLFTVRTRTVPGLHGCCVCLVVPTHTVPFGYAYRSTPTRVAVYICTTFGCGPRAVLHCVYIHCGLLVGYAVTVTRTVTHTHFATVGLLVTVLPAGYTPFTRYTRLLHVYITVLRLTPVLPTYALPAPHTYLCTHAGYHYTRTTLLDSPLRFILVLHLGCALVHTYTLPLFWSRYVHLPVVVHFTVTGSRFTPVLPCGCSCLAPTHGWVGWLYRYTVVTVPLRTVGSPHLPRCRLLPHYLCGYLVARLPPTAGSYRLLFTGLCLVGSLPHHGCTARLLHHAATAGSHGWFYFYTPLRLLPTVTRFTCRAHVCYRLHHRTLRSTAVTTVPHTAVATFTRCHRYATVGYRYGYAFAGVRATLP